MRPSTSMFRILALLLFSMVAVLAEESCPGSNLNNFYRELQCEPLFENASKCPSSYNCDKFEARDKGHCNYRGRSYAIGEKIPENESDPCFKQCVCVRGREQPSFACAVVECPEMWFRPPPEKCFLLYSSDQCCSVDTFCPNETTSAKTRHTCEYDGKTYYEGEKFYPEGDSCKKCYCKPGFRGELEEPFCESIRCNMELSQGYKLKENCAPVYYGEQGCCPISWKCPPASTNFIIPSNGNQTLTTTAKCKFGSLELEQYAILEEDGVRYLSDLSPLDRSLHELGMLSAITDSRYQYMEEMRRKRSLTMDSRGKRCAFHILQINSNFVGSISPCKLCTKRSNHRVKPYFTPINRLFPFQSETVCERTRTKSENSDTGNENLDVKDSETVIASVGLYKSKSLENINTSSHSSSRDFKMELDELKKRTEENTDVELVSSKIKCLNVSNK